MPATMTAHTRSDIERRNQELLQFQDAAFLLALRLCGNIPDAEDVLQDAYLKAAKAEEPLVGGEDLRNWFLHVTANVARDRFRSEQRRRARERNASLEASARSRVHIPLGDDANLRTQINAELSRLDEKLRAPIALHYEQGFSYDEASYVLGVPAATLRVQASRGIEELRRRLAAAGQPVLVEALIAALAVGVAIEFSPAITASIASAACEYTAANAAVAKAPLLIAQSASYSAPAKVVLVAVLCGLSYFAGHLANRNPSPVAAQSLSAGLPVAASLALDERDDPLDLAELEPAVTASPVFAFAQPKQELQAAKPPPPEPELFANAIEIGHCTWKMKGNPITAHSWSYMMPGIMIFDEMHESASIEATMTDEVYGPGGCQGLGLCVGSDAQIDAALKNPTAQANVHGIYVRYNSRQSAGVGRMGLGAVEILNGAAAYNDPVAGNKVELARGTEYTLKLTVKNGKEVEVFFNGKSVLKHTLATRYEGRFSLFSSNGDYTFRNVTYSHDN